MKKFKRIVIAIIVLILCFSAGTFSTSNYWSSETVYPFNLNTYDAVRTDTA